MQPPPAIRYLQDNLDREIAVTDWYRITQEECDAFSHLSGDLDPMHNDPVWAAKTHWGGTIVQAAHVLSISTGILSTSGIPLDTVSDGKTYILNYGYDRVRVIAPLRVGHDFRFRIKILAIRPKSNREFVLTFGFTVEVKDRDTPFMVIEALAFWATGQEMPAVDQDARS